MNNIPKKLREEMGKDSYYKSCCLKSAECEGMIEWHHTLEYAGRQIQKKFAIIPVCSFHHSRVVLFKKRFHWIALSRATGEELKEFERANFKRELVILNKLFGKYNYDDIRRKCREKQGEKY